MVDTRIKSYDLFQVSYPNGKTPELGMKLDANDVKEMPAVSFSNEAGAKYVVLMFGKSQQPLGYEETTRKTR